MHQFRQERETERQKDSLRRTGVGGESSIAFDYPCTPLFTDTQ